MSMRTNASDIKKGGFYTPGIGWSEGEPLVSTDENGQRVVQTSGLQRQGRLTADGGLYQGVGDRLAKSYDNARSTLNGILTKWRRGDTGGGGNNGNSLMSQLYRQYRALGLYNGDFGGFRNWLNQYMQQMQSETMNVSALHNSRGIATKTSDGRMTQSGVNRQNALGGFGNI